MAIPRTLLASMLLYAVCVLAPSIINPAAADRIWQPVDPAGMDNVEAGVPVFELPTLHSIGILWPVRGDDNGDAAVAVFYRQNGSDAWREAYPLFWIHPERQPEQHHVSGGRLFAGSIVGLQPGTTYDVRLVLTDPDGETITENLTTATREVPVAPKGMRMRYVVPKAASGASGGSGAKGDPFQGLEVALSRAEPGDLFLLAAGQYAVQGLQPGVSGAVDKPIIIRGENAESVIIDGGGGDVALDFSGRNHIWLERTTIQNARALLRAEQAKRIVVRGNIFRIILARAAAGVEVLRAASYQFVISDNRFLGPNTGWPAKYKGKKIPEHTNGIVLAGAGHDVSYNEITRVGDGINTGRIGENNAAGSGLRATDIYNNDIDETRTECIEADYSLTNIRIYENRHRATARAPAR